MTKLWNNESRTRQKKQCTYRPSITRGGMQKGKTLITRNAPFPLIGIQGQGSRPILLPIYSIHFSRKRRENQQPTLPNLNYSWKLGLHFSSMKFLALFIGHWRLDPTQTCLRGTRRGRLPSLYPSSIPCLMGSLQPVFNHYTKQSYQCVLEIHIQIIRVGHTNFIVKVKLLWVQDPGYSSKSS